VQKNNEEKMKTHKILIALTLCAFVSTNTVQAATGRFLEIPSGTTKSITENVSGYTNSTLNGGAISNAGTLTISNSASITSNEGKFGGAIENTANLYIKDNVNISSNTGTYGGALYNQKGTIDIVDSTLNSNTVNKGSGGAIWNNNNLTITNSKFNDNTANESTASNGRGGAVYTTGTTTVNNSQFNNNNGYSGGAFYNSGTLTINGNSTKFSENSADYMGGVIFNASNGTVTINDNASFEGNTAQYGGVFVSSGNLDITEGSSFKDNTAIMGGAFYNQGTSTIDKAIFSQNTANITGGAIRTSGTKSSITITNSTFENNYAGEDGAAVSLGTTGILEIDNTKFIANHSDIRSGAVIAELDTTHTSSKMTIKNSLFSKNYTTGYGGALGNYTNATITNTEFSENYNTNEDALGGAMFLGAQSVTTLDNVLFKQNTSAGMGGALSTRTSVYDDEVAKLDILNTKFIENNAALTGGALDNWFFGSKKYENAVYIYNSEFEKNTAGKGGAIYNHEKGTGVGKDGAIIIENSNFTNNTAKEDGGAFYDESIHTTITDSNFIQNSAGGKGGAIFTKGDLTINAEKSDISFSKNTASEGGDIYLDTKDSVLNLNIADGKTIKFEDGISGKDYDIIVNSNSQNTGKLLVTSEIKNAALNFENGTLQFIDNAVLTNSSLTMGDGTTLDTIDNVIRPINGNVTLNGKVNLAIDINLSELTSDSFTGKINGDGVFNIDKVNVFGTTDKSVKIHLSDMTGIDKAHLTSVDQALKKILTPIQYLEGSISGDYLMYTGAGGGYKNFNPAVMASPVAAQLGGYLTQLNSYDEAFRNMDMYMLMTKKQREALKLRNKYAAADSNLIFDPTGTPYDKSAGWVRPFATFENVPLKGGPKVSNVAYGSFFGTESELYDLGNGWDGIWGVYAGYNGSHQAYDGISIYQNGGTLGAVGMAYKGNFYTGLTVNAGANAGEASTMYGNDNFTMIMSGIASKTGYNVELADGKFIIQPNFLMSYSFVNTFDYTNAAGVKIDSDPLHAIQLEPGIKFIGNLKNGWQPYASVSMVWNIMDKTHFEANNVSLPELSVKPYVRYGAGVRKSWGERLTGYFQTFLTNGGRNGIGFQLGFRWALGKSTSKQNKTTEKKAIKTLSMK